MPDAGSDQNLTASGAAAAASATPQSEWRAAILPFVVSRLYAWLTAWLGLLLVPLRPSSQVWRAFPDAAFIDGWARWDAGWYFTIAEQGYSYRVGVASNVNFFPLFPLTSGLLARPLASLLGPERGFYVAAIVLSHVAFFISLAGAFRLARQIADTRVALATVWLIALFPFSLFFSAAYSESLYLALGVWSFVFARERRWALAALLAGLAAVTRIVGILVLAGVTLEYLSQLRRPWRIGVDALWLIFATVPLIALLAYFRFRFGDIIPFLHTQALWGRSFSLMHVVESARALLAGRVHGDDRVLLSWYLILIPTVLAATLLASRRLGIGLVTFVVTSLFMAAGTGLAGNGRYVAVLFPAFIGAAIVLRRAGSVALCLLFTPYLGLFVYLFAHWRRVT